MVVIIFFTLDISLKFFSMEKMSITYSEPKYTLCISGKGLIASLSIKAKARPKILCKKSRYDIGNVIMKELSKIIREFEKLVMR